MSSFEVILEKLSFLIIFVFWTILFNALLIIIWRKVKVIKYTFMLNGFINGFNYVSEFFSTLVNFCIRFWNNPKLYFTKTAAFSFRKKYMNLVYAIVNKPDKHLFSFLFVILFIVIGITITIPPDDPAKVIYGYLILFIFTCIELYLFQNLFVKTTLWVQLLIILFILPLIIFLGLMFAVYVLQGKNFTLLLFALFNFLSLLLTIMISLLNASKKISIILVASIIGILIAGIYILFIFGAYNISVAPPCPEERETSFWPSIAQTIDYGTINAFEYHNLKTGTREGRIQYAIWMIFLGVGLSFITSYALSLIGKSKSGKEI